MTDLSEYPIVPKTNYEREQADFARQYVGLQKRKRARWRLALARIVAGRRGPGELGAGTRANRVP